MIHPGLSVHAQVDPGDGFHYRNGLHPCVLGSRILGGYALKGGMPLWKYIANRFLTLAENILLGAKLSEYHTGYRAFSREILERLHLRQFRRFRFRQPDARANSLARFHDRGSQLPDEIFSRSSSINFRRSIRYGFGCLGTGLAFRLAKMGIANPGYSRPPSPIQTSEELKRFSGRAAAPSCRGCRRARLPTNPVAADVSRLHLKFFNSAFLQLFRGSTGEFIGGILAPNKKACDIRQLT